MAGKKKKEKIKRKKKSQDQINKTSVLVSFFILLMVAIKPPCHRLLQFISIENLVKAVNAFVSPIHTSM